MSIKGKGVSIYEIGTKEEGRRDCKIGTLQLLTGLTQDKDLNNLGNVQNAEESLRCSSFICSFNFAAMKTMKGSTILATAISEERNASTRIHLLEFEPDLSSWNAAM